MFLFAYLIHRITRTECPPRIQGIRHERPKVWDDPILEPKTISEASRKVRGIKDWHTG